MDEIRNSGILCERKAGLKSPAEKRGKIYIKKQYCFLENII